jgi:N-acetylmuramoyl-L-alanine amidase
MDREIIRRKKQLGKKRERKRKRRNRVVFAVRLVTIVFCVSAVILLACFGVYLFNRFRGKEDSVQTVQGIFNGGKEVDTEYAGCTVVLDAGHGGSDQGTAYEDYLEKDINLAVTLKVKEYMELHGAEVILTRSEDKHVGLKERTTLANQYEADLFVSLHCNYYEKDDTISGLECYYYNDASTGKAYADGIFQVISERGNVVVRDVKPENYYVLRNTSAPAVLVEMGYLSNQSDRLNLLSEKYQDTLAEDLAQGILESLKE